ncbi:MAG TPA: hypothetical protein VJ327_03095 [Patescibacteria group bacterium]|nr:hypothetical protein [Patescibacteria group bacterium]
MHLVEALCSPILRENSDLLFYKDVNDRNVLFAKLFMKLMRRTMIISDPEEKLVLDALNQNPFLLPLGGVLAVPREFWENWVLKVTSDLPKPFDAYVAKTFLDIIAAIGFCYIYDILNTQSTALKEQFTIYPSLLNLELETEKILGSVYNYVYQAFEGDIKGKTEEEIQKVLKEILWTQKLGGSCQESRDYFLQAFYYILF